MNSTPDQDVEITELQRIKFVLDYLGLENFFLSKSESLKDNTILIVFPEIKEEQYRVSLQLNLINEKKPGEDREGNTMLHFYFDPKIKTREENLVDIIDLIAKLNNILPFGSYGFSDENEVFFRYIYPYSEEQIVPALLSELLDMMYFFLNKTGNSLKAFANGELSFDEALMKASTFRQAGF